MGTEPEITGGVLTTDIDNPGLPIRARLLVKKFPKYDPALPYVRSTPIVGQPVECFQVGKLTIPQELFNDLEANGLFALDSFDPTTRGPNGAVLKNMFADAAGCGCHPYAVYMAAYGCISGWRPGNVDQSGVTTVWRSAGGPPPADSLDAATWAGYVPIAGENIGCDTEEGFLARVGVPESNKAYLVDTVEKIALHPATGLPMGGQEVVLCFIYAKFLEGDDVSCNPCVDPLPFGLQRNDVVNAIDAEESLPSGSAILNSEAAYDLATGATLTSSDLYDD